MTRGDEPDCSIDDVEVYLEPLPSEAHVITSPGSKRGPTAPVPIESTAPQSSWRGVDGWAAYFPDELEVDESCAGRALIVEKLRKFFTSTYGRAMLSAVPENSFALPLDFQAISRQGAHPALRSVADILEPSPDEALPCLGLAASRAAEQLYSRVPGAEPLLVTQEHRLWPRIYNFSSLTSLRSLKGSSVGKFVGIRGTVVRVSSIRQQVASMQFECLKCGGVLSRNFPDYKYTPPVSCLTEKCRSRSFMPLYHTAETVDWQKIRVQEIIDNDDETSAREEGRMPRTIDAELFADLIDSCIPGDSVTVCGIVRVLSVDVAGGGGGMSKASKAGKCLYYLYIEANSTIASRKSQAKAQHSATAACISELDDRASSAIHEVIREVVREGDPFAFLVNSAIPSIYGHELVKSGMLLALFGGSPKERLGGKTSSQSGTVAIRRDVHCLVVGDPGLGKSQMLKAIANIAPRGVYVCGNTTSTAGLTVTVVREATGDFALEAGALVLGDRGVCCIDEFDKMSADHGALLEAMEQQSVSVAKAGMLCNLSARTTVIAAANPVGGHYDRSKTVCENLKMPMPLLSRFDLVFILVDKPDEKRDQFISEHVMAMFGMRSATRALKTPSSVRDGPRIPDFGLTLGSTQRTDPPTSETLLQRLRSKPVADPLPPSLFRQYIAYARAHVHPELSEGAKHVFQDFYLTLRKGAHEQAADTTPITTRQLESLVRLGEARARAVMRTVVTEADARDVIEIMRESMLATLTDENGTIDLGRSTGMSRSKDARRYVAALHAEAQRLRSAVFEKASLRRVATAVGIEPHTERFVTLIETINYQGYLTKKAGGRYELQSSSFSSPPPTRSRSQKRSGAGSQAQRRQFYDGHRNGRFNGPRTDYSSDEYEE